MSLLDKKTLKPGPGAIWLVPLEPIETRYTCEWFTHIPSMLAREAENKRLQMHYLGASYAERYAYVQSFPLEAYQGADVLLFNLVPDTEGHTASDGAFINFASTNIWKSKQAQMIAQAFTCGYVHPGDVFYFTDAWNPTVIQVRYMSDLLGIPVSIVGQWHAGWHDKNDFLGRNAGTWAKDFERSLAKSLTVNLFTTKYYLDMFLERLEIGPGDPSFRRMVAGYPNSYLPEQLGKYFNQPRNEQIVLFPHRLAPEKNPDIFWALKAKFEAEGSSVQFIAAQEQPLTKREYHELLGRSSIVFSCASQETYGIAQTEAVFAGAIPLSPNNLSYKEMYYRDFLYPSSWVEERNIDSIAERIRVLLNSIQGAAQKQRDAEAGGSPRRPWVAHHRLEQQAKYLNAFYIGDSDISALLFRLLHSPGSKACAASASETPNEILD